MIVLPGDPKSIGGSSMADIIIKNGYLLTMDPELGDLDSGTVVVKDGRITHVGGPVDEPADRVIDAGGCVVMPGLVNTHGHAAMTLLRGMADDVSLKSWLEESIWPAEAGLSESDVLLGTRLACLEMIKSGTTAYADMYFHVDQAARAAVDSGLRAALSYGMIDLGDREKADRELEEGGRVFEKWHGAADGRITAMYAPHAPNTCSIGFLERIRDRARKDGAAMHIHILETQAEKNAMIAEHGVSSVRLLDDMGFFESPVLAAHCVWPSEEEIGILADRGVHVSHNPVSNMKLASGIAPAARMLDAGVRLSLGTDGCASNNNLDLFEEMKTAALLQKVATGDPTVLSARDILGMATVNGADALGFDGGMIREGKKADLIIVDFQRPHLSPAYDVPSHLVYAARGSDVVTTIADGKILMDDRKVLSLDEREILRDVSRRSKGLHFPR